MCICLFLSSKELYLSSRVWFHLLLLLERLLLLFLSECEYVVKSGFNIHINYFRKLLIIGEIKKNVY
jgi:hypothetical protein